MEDDLHPSVARILDGLPAGFLSTLTTQLSGADLTALLLEVFRRRAASMTAADVRAQYERDRFVRPSRLDPLRMIALERMALETVAPQFTPLVCAPLAPLGTHAVVAGVSQNRVVTTVRGTEVAADPTNGLALEAAVRRRQLLAHDPRASDVVRLAAVDRVVRAQLPNDPRSTAHFSLLGLVSAGRDTGGFGFEKQALLASVEAGVALVRRAGFERFVVRFTDFSGTHDDVIGHATDALVESGIAVEPWPHRTLGRGYYPGVCCKLAVQVGDDEVEVGDGGFVDWTKALVGSAKERLMIFGVGLDRLVAIGARTDGC